METIFYGYSEKEHRSDRHVCWTIIANRKKENNFLSPTHPVLINNFLMQYLNWIDK